MSDVIFILGTVQDGGYPQTGCVRPCCIKEKADKAMAHFISSIAILLDSKFWLIDVTPDLFNQLQLLRDHGKLINGFESISGVFITHAHIGHYTGLLEFGLEVMDLKNIPVYVMPKMKQFLEKNAPFSQLVINNNIILHELKENIPFNLGNNISIVPFQVPHRNELSETVGFTIIAILDGTFYEKKELRNRNIKYIPHPTIQESMNLFSTLEKMQRRKVYFTHLNHTNNVLRIGSDERNNVLDQGYKIAEEGMIFEI